MKESWKGESRGTVLGYRIFFATLRLFGIRGAYALLRFVAFYYFLFAWKVVKIQYNYFRSVHNYPWWKAYFSVYGNIVQFGQTLIDKVVVMSDRALPFQVIREGEDLIREALREGNGVLLVSAHVGNWEAAGQLLNSLDTTVNLVMMDLEKEQIKGFLKEKMKERKLNIITIGDDLTHLLAIKQAFARNEIVALHGDRFIAGQRTMEQEFFGRPAHFPLGPFILSSKLKVPTLCVFCMKQTSLKYHFYAYPAGETGAKPEVLLAQFVNLLSQKIEAYPRQWYNYYDFWAPQTPEI